MLNPPEDPYHCPPGVTWAYFLDGGQAAAPPPTRSLKRAEGGGGTGGLGAPGSVRALAGATRTARHRPALKPLRARPR